MGGGGGRGRGGVDARPYYLGSGFNGELLIFIYFYGESHGATTVPAKNRVANQDELAHKKYFFGLPREK